MTHPTAIAEHTERDVSAPWRRTHLPIIAFVIVTLADLTLTLSAWHLESNPVALALGRQAWVAVKVGVVLSIPAMWLRDELWRSRAAVLAVIAYDVLMAVIVTWNVGMIV